MSDILNTIINKKKKPNHNPKTKEQKMMMISFG